MTTILLNLEDVTRLFLAVKMVLSFVSFGSLYEQMHLVWLLLSWLRFIHAACRHSPVTLISVDICNMHVSAFLYALLCVYMGARAHVYSSTKIRGLPFSFALHCNVFFV